MIIKSIINYLSFRFLRKYFACFRPLWYCLRWWWRQFYLNQSFLHGEGEGAGGGSYFPYILLNEIQTMFSQLAKRSARVLPADLCTDHAHYVKNHRSTVLSKNKNMAVDRGTVSHYYILVIRKFIDFMSLFRHSVWFSMSYRAVFCCKP